MTASHHDTPTPDVSDPLELDIDKARALASLVGIGCQSGDVVMGLSAVRRLKSPALLFVAASLASGTVTELSRVGVAGRLYRVPVLKVMTATAGRSDVMVMAVKAGSLAEGMIARLE